MNVEDIVLTAAIRSSGSPEIYQTFATSAAARDTRLILLRRRKSWMAVEVTNSRRRFQFHDRRREFELA